MLGVALVTTGARIHCGDQHKRSRVSHALRRTTDADLAVLKWLPQHFKDVFLKLRHFVEKQHTIVR